MNYIVYRQEKEPNNKQGIWIHHKIYNDPFSPVIAQIYVNNKWKTLNEDTDKDYIKGYGINTIISLTRSEYTAIEDKSFETLYIVSDTIDNDNDDPTVTYTIYIGTVEISGGGGSTAGVTSIDGETGALTTKTVNGTSILGSGNIVVSGEFKVVTVSDISDLTSQDIDELNVGDQVLVNDSGDYTIYLVSYSEGQSYKSLYTICDGIYKLYEYETDIEHPWYLSDTKTFVLEPPLQADWNQTNSSADDYIKNKPTPLIIDDVLIYTEGIGYELNFSTTTVPYFYNIFQAFLSGRDVLFRRIKDGQGYDHESIVARLVSMNFMYDGTIENPGTDWTVEIGFSVANQNQILTYDYSH